MCLRHSDEILWDLLRICLEAMFFSARQNYLNSRCSNIFWNILNYCGHCQVLVNIFRNFTSVLKSLYCLPDITYSPIVFSWRASTVFVMVKMLVDLVPIQMQGCIVYYSVLALCKLSGALCHLKGYSSCPKFYFENYQNHAILLSLFIPSNFHDVWEYKYCLMKESCCKICHFSDKNAVTWLNRVICELGCRGVRQSGTCPSGDLDFPLFTPTLRFF